MKRKILKIIIVSTILILIAAGAVFLFQKGYRFSFISGAYKSGSLRVHISEKLDDAELFLDGKRQEMELADGNFVQFDELKPGKHSIIVSKYNYWPWQKSVNIEPNSTADSSALLVPRNPQWNILISPSESQSGKSLEELAKSGKIIKDAAAAQNIFKKSADGIELYLDEERLVLSARWLGLGDSVPYFFCDDSSCKREITVLTSKSQIKSFDFYPGKNDALIVAVQDGIYAIELDSRGQRMLFPVYKGRSPVSIVYGGEKSVYVFDEDSLAEIKLD